MRTQLAQTKGEFDTADVKWIKIVTDIFDDQKIRFIETMPNGDSIIVIWFKLMCLAGKSNSNGYLMMTDKIAYTDDILASIFSRDIKLIQLSLTTFEKLDMVEITDNKLCLLNWEKHQNAERLSELREQSRLSSAKCRSKQVLPSHTVTGTSRDCHGDDTDKDIDIDKDKDTTSSQSDFDVFWSAYPRKVGKDAARKSFAKAKTDLQTILLAIEAQKKSEQWRRDKGQYIPHPATWLNQGRWQDELETPPVEQEKPKPKKYREVVINGETVMEVVNE